MQRAGVESILGLRIIGASLHVDPCIPKTWPGFGIVLRYRSARYDIEIENPSGVSRGVALAELDGAALQLRPAGIPLVDDGAIHRLRIVLG
jgi:cyclic beta-1,2-glucan synthetase